MMPMPTLGRQWSMADIRRQRLFGNSKTSPHVQDRSWGAYYVTFSDMQRKLANVT